ncbi:soluble quino protein glucose/sorbosone dehydrogenase, partial [Lasiosphaeria miniovina]
MKTTRAAKAALAAGLSASIVAAQGCSNVIVPSHALPVVASGWQAQLVVAGLVKPRSIQFDSTGALLVVESGKGVTRHSFTDNGGTCVTLTKSTVLIDQAALNHGLALSADGKTLYASSVDSVFAWDYDPNAGSVGGRPVVVVNNMGNNDLVTRTLLMSKKQTNTLLVSRGSSDGNEAKATVLSSGLSQIRAFDLSASKSRVYDYDTDGTVLGWGLRNSVGVGEHPITGGIYAVENSIDGVTRDGKDIHENNPGEELNFFGYLNATKANQGGNYGYPKCFAVWDVSEIPESDGLGVGKQFAIQENSTLTDETCASDYVAPRLTFPAHYAPIDIKFAADGKTAYVTFRGSFDKTQPAGYRLASVAFNADTGEPVASPDSNDALTDILTNANQTDCPDKCFRPVGLAFDAAGRLWMTADSTGEIYVLQKTSSSPTATTGGTFVTAT